MIEEDLVIAQLMEVKSLRILSVDIVQYALRRVKGTNTVAVSVTQAQKIAELIKAQHIVWGVLDHKKGQWLAKAYMLDVTTGKVSSGVQVASTHFFDIADRVTEYVVTEIGAIPTDIERQKMRRRWTTSSVALEWYGKGKLFTSQRMPTAEVERSYREAIKVDPQFGEAYTFLAAILSIEGKWTEAEKVIREGLLINPLDAHAHQVLSACLLASNHYTEAESHLHSAAALDPDDADTFARLGYIECANNNQSQGIEHFVRAIELNPYSINVAAIRAQLGCAYARSGNRPKALKELDESSQMAAAGDMSIQETLSNGYGILHVLPKAIEHAEALLNIAKQSGLSPEALSAAESKVTEWKLRLTTSYITNLPPTTYSLESLKQVFHDALTSEERGLVVDPLFCSTEMQRWALEIVAGATNDMQKALALFEALSQRPNSNSLIDQVTPYTAEEAFAAWVKPEAAIRCQGLTCLFVALARALKVKAYVVSVDEAFNGSKSLHSCAAVYIDNIGLLVDVTYQWFGVPHKHFRILNDVQSTALYCCSVADLKHRQLAAKLAPELALVEYNLCGALIGLNRWTEAKPLLRRVTEVDRNGVMKNYLRAVFAIHSADLDLAVNCLQAAIQIDPSDAASYIQLGYAYMAMGKANDARACFESALRCPHSAADAKAIDRLLKRP